MAGAGGGEGGSGRAARRLLAAAGILLGAAPALGFDARVTWQSVQGAAGYRLYVRQLGQAYGSGVNVGSPAADAGGVIRYVTTGVPIGLINFFAVTAYDSLGRESSRSNEFSLLVGASVTASRTATASRTQTSSGAATPTRTGTPLPSGSAAASATPTATSMPGSPVAVSGEIRYYADGGPVPDVSLSLQGPLGERAALSDAEGEFGFAAVSAGIWQLAPRKEGDANNAVSALDAAYVLQVLSGTRSFDALQALACDVTGNGAVSALDATRILQLTVRDIERFALAELCESDWLFVPEPLPLPLQQLIQPLFEICQAGAIAFLPLLSNATQQDFTAALLGDCTGSWSATESGAALRQFARPARVWLEAPRARPGGRWVVALAVEGRDAVIALTARLAYDPSSATLETVDAVGATEDTMVHHRDDGTGLLTIALASPEPLVVGARPLLRLVFNATDAPSVWLLDATVDDVVARVVDSISANPAPARLIL